MLDRFGLPVVTLLVCFFVLHARLRVRLSTRHSLRPLYRGSLLANPGVGCAAGSKIYGREPGNRTVQTETSVDVRNTREGGYQAHRGSDECNASEYWINRFRG
jgi:hypothetical protein